MSSSISKAALIAVSFGISAASMATAQNAPLSAQDSDPRVMGWMEGFPPPPDKLITQPDSNFFSFPKLRWSVCHLREFLPTEEVSRGLGAPVPLDYLTPAEFAKTAREIDALTFTPIDGDAPMTWEQSLYANYTDGILILHKDRVVYERYFGCLAEDGKHAAMSMTKSVTGLLGEILVAEGVLDDTALVRDIIPEIGDSAFATATVREVMDMTTGVQYSENYSDPNADIWLYSRAASPLPKPEGYEGPDGYWEYLQQVKPEGNHGDQFHYKTINSDMLGWMISRVTGKSVTELASERLWRRMGAEQDAYQTVDGKGVPVRRRRTECRSARSGSNRSADAERGRDQRRAPFPGRCRGQYPRRRGPGKVRGLPHDPEWQLHQPVVGLPQRPRSLRRARRARANDLCRSDRRYGSRAVCVVPAGAERLYRPDLAARLSGCCGIPHVALTIASNAAARPVQHKNLMPATPALT